MVLVGCFVLRCWLLLLVVAFTYWGLCFRLCNSSIFTFLNLVDITGCACV